MGAIELRSNIYQIIDSIESEQLLQTLYDFLKVKDQKETGRLWDELTDDQKNELLLSYEESEDENNLIDAKKVFKKLS